MRAAFHRRSWKLEGIGCSYMFLRARDVLHDERKQLVPELFLKSAVQNAQFDYWGRSKLEEMARELGHMSLSPLDASLVVANILRALEERRLVALEVPRFRSSLSPGAKPRDQEVGTAPELERQSKFGVARLSTPRWFAPGVEALNIGFTLLDPDRVISSVDVEVFRRGSESPVWRKSLGTDEWSPGENELSWNGQVDVSPELPDGHLTLEFSPYRVKVTVKGKGIPSPGSRETVFRVECAGLEVQLAPDYVLKELSDTVIRRRIPALPAASPIRLELNGNFFAESSAEMETGDAMLEYRRYWDEGRGPRIPLLATIRVRRSDGEAVRSGKALGRARVLWDFQEPAPSEPARFTSPKAQAYVEDRLIRAGKAGARPRKGQNTPVGHGRSRTLPSGRSCGFRRPNQDWVRAVHATFGNRRTRVGSLSGTSSRAHLEGRDPSARGCGRRRA